MCPASNGNRTCTPEGSSAGRRSSLGYAQVSRGPARAVLDQTQIRASMDRRVLGSFLEHLGRASMTFKLPARSYSVAQVATG